VERIPTSHRKLARSEEQAVLATLHSERFQDHAPRQVYAELLDEGTYLASPSTMYRILAVHGESGERRNQRESRSHAVRRCCTAAEQTQVFRAADRLTRRPYCVACRAEPCD
jgi:IS30 family transposase